MADTLNSPPILSPMVNDSGRVTQAWVSWLNTIYRRVGEALGRSTSAIDSDVTALSGRVTSVESRVAVLETGPALPSYTVTGVPAASGNARRMIWVTDAAAGAFAYVSNGTSWLRLSDGTVLA